MTEVERSEQSKPMAEEKEREATGKIILKVVGDSYYDEYGSPSSSADRSLVTECSGSPPSEAIEKLVWLISEAAKHRIRVTKREPSEWPEPPGLGYAFDIGILLNKFVGLPTFNRELKRYSWLNGSLVVRDRDIPFRISGFNLGLIDGQLLWTVGVSGGFIYGSRNETRYSGFGRVWQPYSLEKVQRFIESPEAAVKRGAPQELVKALTGSGFVFINGMPPAEAEIAVNDL